MVEGSSGEILTSHANGQFNFEQVKNPCVGTREITTCKSITSCKVSFEFAQGGSILWGRNPCVCNVIMLGPLGLLTK